MCFNILFRKNGRFPDTEVGSNEHLRKKGIKCMKEEEEELWLGKTPSSGNLPSCTSNSGNRNCSDCGYYVEEKIRCR